MTAALAALYLLVGFPGPASANPDVITLESGHSIVLHVADLRRVAVGDGTIAGVVPIGTSQLIINGKEPGRTSVFVWSGFRRVTYEVKVSFQTLDDLTQMLQAAVSEPNVDVVSFHHAIVLRGTVPDMAHFVQMNDLIARFADMAKQDKYSIVNAVTITHSLGSLQGEFASSKTVHDLQIEPDGKGDVMVSGRVHDAAEEQKVLDRARALAGPFLAVDGKVVDRLTLETASQINVKVYVLEVDRTGMSDLGIQLQAGNPDPNNPNNIILGPPNYPVIEGPQASNLGKALNIGAFFRTARIVPTLNLVLQSGHARLLSSPTLVTLPGQKATFLVGGEFPYIYSTGLGEFSVQFKQYGVQLNVTPQILPNGAIQALINPDISDLDFQNAVEMNGFLVPALKESTLSTDVITQPGESVIIGGLLRRVEEKTISKIPLLSDIPILGKLFQSTNYQRQDSDVVFVMTPEIINQ